MQPAIHKSNAFFFKYNKTNETNNKLGSTYSLHEQRFRQSRNQFTLTYATGGISARRPVNIVTRVNMHVTNKVTRPGIASKPNQNENHDNITTKVDGANVWIR